MSEGALGKVEGGLRFMPGLMPPLLHAAFCDPYTSATAPRPHPATHLMGSAAWPRVASSDEISLVNTTNSKYASRLRGEGHRRCPIFARPSNGLDSRCHSTARSPILHVPRAPRHKSRATRRSTLGPAPARTPTSSAPRAPHMPPARPAHQARPLVIRVVHPPAPHPALLFPTALASSPSHITLPPVPVPTAPHPSPARRGRRR
ncbi:hypothetical protein DFH09DRAFT_1370073 [Mycena vulgaris]|nr:hypothetical protein DFH09DRAFT_1370073 [Mycena vulgaris]